MILVVRPDYRELSIAAADVVRQAVQDYPQLTLGLPTGSTPLGLYHELIRHHRAGLDLSRIQTFNMDEYIGLPKGAFQSYRSYMFREFFDHVNVLPGNIHLPDVQSPSGLDTEAQRYEEAIKNAGGIDFQIVGIGVNGHIGFNEPGSSPTSRTRVVTLAESTRAGMRRYFPDPGDMPQTALTVGVGTIMDARRIVLLASGDRKAGAVARALKGPITSDVPASFLQTHPDLTVILDTTAGSQMA